MQIGSGSPHSVTEMASWQQSFLYCVPYFQPISILHNTCRWLFSVTTQPEPFPFKLFLSSCCILLPLPTACHNHILCMVAWTSLVDQKGLRPSSAPYWGLQCLTRTVSLFQALRNSTIKMFHDRVIVSLMAGMLASQTLIQCSCVSLLPVLTLHQVSAISKPSAATGASL